MIESMVKNTKFIYNSKLWKDVCPKVLQECEKMKLLISYTTIGKSHVHNDL
jgi:hypothetical protein